jgi:hypothetical protein
MFTLLRMELFLMLITNRKKIDRCLGMGRDTGWVEGAGTYHDK